MHRVWNMIPDDVKQPTPGEILKIDFFNYNQQDMLVIEDKQLGYLEVRRCKIQTEQALLPWFYSYRICHDIRADGAGSFRDSFTKKLENLGIKHKHISQYNSESNNGAERFVRKRIIKCDITAPSNTVDDGPRNVNSQPSNQHAEPAVTREKARNNRSARQRVSFGGVSVASQA